MAAAALLVAPCAWLGPARAQGAAQPAGTAGTAGTSGSTGATGTPATGGADGESFEAALRTIGAGRIPQNTGISLDVPQLSENGNAVELSVLVESPMTPADHVRAIHVLSPMNPSPRVASFYLGPRAGRAQVATRIRLATTQTLVVLAETSTGALLKAEREVIVVLGACVDGG